MGEDADILLADARYRWVQAIIEQCVDHTAVTIPKWTTRLDNVVLHRVLGIPLFLVVMYLMFLFSINVGGAFQDFFDISSETIFVSGLATALNALQAPGWLIALLANGIGKGINTTITFVPVIGAMFLFLALLEDSGYMARAAFVVDRGMRALGLPGKAFVPMIVGFGCNVPAVMGARTLEHKRDRILTIMMSPFMSCGARLAIFAVFAAAFFPNSGQNIVFALYLVGIGMALLTGLVLRKTLLHGEPSPFVLELPPYHVPHVRTLLLHAWQRLKGFVFRAGRLIIPICMLIGALNAINLDGTLSLVDGDMNSLLSSLGRWVTPIFAPMGIYADNWPATVGLVTGILAKEVVVGSLNTLYSQVGHLTSIAPVDGFQLWTSLVEAARSIPANLSQLGGALANPLVAEAPIHSLDQGVYGVMYRYFDGKIGAFAYLLFVLLYFPCISTTAAMLRELHRGWAIFSICWMTGIAYGASVFFYQAATWSRHPLSSSLWLSGVGAAFAVTIWAIRWVATQQFQVTFTVPPTLTLPHKTGGGN
ncbi:MAG: ferrous iron transport protein B [Gammaproteobacteria bacterium RIFCSPHIGHO2_12_FULL_45_9]|nr:MAG: ferrous iron transport protein B [Gammaproteobacteria bacterium RIFCSPHIGHO2_12_FULL_45_9]